MIEIHYSDADIRAYGEFEGKFNSLALGEKFVVFSAPVGIFFAMSLYGVMYEPLLALGNLVMCGIVAWQMKRIILKEKKETRDRTRKLLSAGAEVKLDEAGITYTTEECVRSIKWKGLRAYFGIGEGIVLANMYFHVFVPQRVMQDPEAKQMLYERFEKYDVIAMEDPEDNRALKINSFLFWLMIGVIIFAVLLGKDLAPQGTGS